MRENHRIQTGTMPTEQRLRRIAELLCKAIMRMEATNITCDTPVEPDTGDWHVDRAIRIEEPADDLVHRLGVALPDEVAPDSVEHPSTRDATGHEGASDT